MSSYLQITYRNGKPFAAYYQLPRRAGDVVDSSEVASANIVVDYAADGRAIGIEIVNPSHITPEELAAVFQQLGLAPPVAEDMAPLMAA